MSHWVKPRKGYIVVEVLRTPVIRHQGLVHVEHQDKDTNFGRVVVSQIDDIAVGALVLFSNYEGLEKASFFPDKKVVILRDDQVVCEIDEEALHAAAAAAASAHQKAEAAASASLEAERARLHAVNNLTT